jgi:uncharacterized protein (DUF1501 family)
VVDPSRVLRSRREVLQSLAGGLGVAALASLLGRSTAAAATPGPGSLHPWQVIAPRAKRVIYLFMAGGTSHIDLFDPKPVLRKRDGEPCPDEFFERDKLAFIQERPNLLGSPYAFEQCGRAGRWVSELLPHHKGLVDDVTFIKSMQTGHFNHAQAQLLLLTGTTRYGRPSTGAWLSYGLGSETDDLPCFVVMNTGAYLSSGVAAWGAGFLPSVHQGVEFRSRKDPVLYLSDPIGQEPEETRDLVDTVNELNRQRFAAVADPEIETRIAQYEMAYRMQTSVPGVMDIREEPASVHEMYGTVPGKASFANNCLLARRLIERGVRFVQLFDNGWDHHSAIFTVLPQKCAEVDRAAVALVRDLKERGLLDDTLVIFATEFGRTPMGQIEDENGVKGAVGRDHDLSAFTIWLAGGGVKAGYELGRTDDIGYRATENPVHVHDLNATLLHLLGIDHEKLTYRFQGRDYRLTDVHGEVVHSIIA